LKINSLCSINVIDLIKCKDQPPAEYFIRNRDYSKEKYPALLATSQTVRVKEHPFNIRAQDVLGEGDFYVEIAIFPKNSDFIKCVFRIHVTNDWHQLSMERIS